jgi:hypothetical protein
VTAALAALEARLATKELERDAIESAQTLLAIAEEALERWVVARGDVPTGEQREGFRLLALHRQGARGVPSFNACRETCREIAYHYNLLTMAPHHDQSARRARMMQLLVNHLVLFVSGKMEVEGLGEFCCASRPLRTEPST